MEKHITAIVLVPKVEPRQPSKANRPFAGSTLLELKVQTLLSIEQINEVIVSSCCTATLALAEKAGAKTQLCDPYYLSDSCSKSEQWEYLALNTGKYEHILMTDCTTPFISANTVLKTIQTYFFAGGKGLVTVRPFKKFLLNPDGSPHNFEIGTTPNNRKLPRMFEVVFGVCIATRSDIITSKCIFGPSPTRFVLSDIEAVVINTEDEYTIAEAVQCHNKTQQLCLDKGE